MIKTLVAHTREIDNLELAVREILGQVDPEKDLCANTVGIINCHREFVHSGAVEAICEALPFDIMGIVTTAQAAGGESDIFLLSIMILTSDDASFATTTTSSLLPSPAEVIEQAYHEAASQKEEKPALVLAFLPFLLTVSGDDYVEALTNASGGVPCFGAISLDESDSLEACFLICNGEHHADRMGMILVYTDRAPQFFTATISPGKVLKKSALITKSEKNILKELNGTRVLDYFTDLGLADASRTRYAMASIPLMLNYNDGTPPVSRVITGYTPEQDAICGGMVLEGSTISLGVFEKDDVILTAGEAVDKALAGADGASCMLLYTCVARCMSLGGESMAELDLVKNKLGGRLPFLMASSGGEICPTQITDTKAVNRFHNNTLVICVL